MIAWLKAYSSSAWSVVTVPIIVALLTFGVTATFFSLKSEPAPVGVHMPASRASEVKSESTTPIRIDMVKVFKPEVKKKLDLPKHVQENENQHVASSVKTPADDRPHTVTNVLDVTTGELTTYDRADPLPLLAVKSRTHLSAYYGLKDGSRAVRLQAQQEFLQVKALRLEGVASADIGIENDSVDSFIGIGAKYTF